MSSNSVILGEEATVNQPKSARMACPLCGQCNVFVAKQLSAAPLVKYWNALEYDLNKAFPQLQNGISKWQCVDCDLRSFTPQAIGGPDLYRALGRSSLYYDAGKWEFSFVLRRLAQRQRGGLLLELGCGPGRFLERAVPYYDRVVGLDFNNDAVREGRAHGLDVRACGLGELNEAFDTIAAFQVIEHVPNPGETLRQLVKLLRPGGELIVAVPNEDSLLGALEQNCLNLPPHHASLWTKEAFNSVARLLSLKFEDYAREPLSLDLYLGSLHERFDRYLAGRSIMMRPWLWLIRRLAIARALVSFDMVQKEKPGHTHIAFFRKPA